MVGQLRNVQQPFQAVFEAHEDAEVGDLGDRAFNDLAKFVLAGNVAGPGVFGELLQTQGDAAAALVDRKHTAFDLLILLDEFAGMADLAGPRHVADVQEPVDSLFDLDEGAVVGQIANRARDDAVGRIAVGHLIPGIFLRLLDTQGDFLLVLVDIQHDDLDLVVDLNQIAGMADSLGPGHFADVHQTLDTLFELDEGSVAHHVYDCAADLCADGIAVLDFFPRTGRFLLQTQSNLFFFVVDVEDLDLDLFVDGNHFRGVVDASPTHVGDVQEAVDSAQVDEGAELSDIFDHALAALADFEILQQLGFLFSALGFDQSATADDDVTAGLVDFQDDALDRAADEIADVGRATDVDLTGRQEHVHADVDQQSAFDFAGDLSGDDVVLVDRFHDLHPGLDPLGLAFAEADHTAGIVNAAENVLDVFDQDLDCLPDFRRRFSFVPLVAVNSAFALVADVDENEIAVYAENFALDNLIDGDVMPPPIDFILRRTL